MGKRILIYLFMCGAAINMAFSQADVGKQINSIKRDGQYFYAESTLETEDEARISATLMLANFINDYINSNNLPHDKKITEQDLAKAQSLTMKRGPMMRVFLYVKKTDFVSTDAVNIQVTKEEPVAQEPVVAKEPAKVQTPAEPVEKKEPLPATPEQTVDANKKKVEEQPITASLIQTNEAVVGNSALRLPVEWQQNAIDEMLKESSLKNVMTLLNRFKAEYKVKRFGTYNECANAANSFWIICESDSSMSLVTILGPGVDSRVNFKTLEHDSLGNYSGKNAIWFELAK